MGFHDIWFHFTLISATLKFVIVIYSMMTLIEYTRKMLIIEDVYSSHCMYELHFECISTGKTREIE